MRKIPSSGCCVFILQKHSYVFNACIENPLEKNNCNTRDQRDHWSQQHLHLKVSGRGENLFLSEEIRQVTLSKRHQPNEGSSFPDYTQIVLGHYVAHTPSVPCSELRESLQYPASLSEGFKSQVFRSSASLHCLFFKTKVLSLFSICCFRPSITNLYSNINVIYPQHVISRELQQELRRTSNRKHTLHRKQVLSDHHSILWNTLFFWKVK